ncbi:hypothetical protein PGT21_033334 [Puccinia graminis f. sp. tritici]|uniref:Uncharacterized protein n=1 Tax=Puccinia graminis f. sp. tritici TaxID=56615 RepID=A0A5B0MZP6_PUCGR|nr:hypothetical protein PGTUg99_017314 [Puccinia graminis f. sp. tritici]KAA1075250.1 hypothetical protein PGT21_032153 [Puccinia graminis f. sp. tritici]KAA1081299.1 hypothetical protein PGT21_033334 [Puccinia graminis f. sp. tritici]KAA1130248.1 hypothetical protein PGTUg99_017483 [Puccinia graminis f. sp. tritici]
MLCVDTSAIDGCEMKEEDASDDFSSCWFETEWFLGQTCKPFSVPSSTAPSCEDYIHLFLRACNRLDENRQAKCRIAQSLRRPQRHAAIAHTFGTSSFIGTVLKLTYVISNSPQFLSPQNRSTL